MRGVGIILGGPDLIRQALYKRIQAFPERDSFVAFEGINCHIVGRSMWQVAAGGLQEFRALDLQPTEFCQQPRSLEEDSKPQAKSINTSISALQDPEQKTELS